jgi:hypothetical protein
MYITADMKCHDRQPSVWTTQSSLEPAQRLHFVQERLKAVLVYFNQTAKFHSLLEYSWDVKYGRGVPWNDVPGLFHICRTQIRNLRSLELRQVGFPS